MRAAVFTLIKPQLKVCKIIDKKLMRMCFPKNFGKVLRILIL